MLVTKSRSFMALSWRVCSSRAVPTTTFSSTLHAHNRRNITSKAARALLGLPAKSSKTETSPLTLKELRHAYFLAAKKCHPDVKPASDDEEGEGAEDDFLQLTRAYELLQGEITKNQNEDLIMSAISATEEEEFRQACRTQLGLDAEVVEECKRNPMFVQWLGGNTDAAYHWRCFFTQYGGLAPKLRPSGGQLEVGSTPLPSHMTRRKRR